MAVYSWCSACGNRGDRCASPSSHKREVRYRLDLQLGGRTGRRIRDLFDKAADARAAEIELRSKFQRGEYIPQLEGTRTLFKEFIDKYEDEHVRVNNRNPALIHYQLEVIKRVLGDKEIRLITRQDLVDAQTKMRTTMKAASVNRYFNTIGAILNYAKKREVIDKNPCELVTNLKQDDPPLRFLTQVEIAKFRRSIKSQRLQDFVTVMLHTGARPSSIEWCSWDSGDVDFECKTIWFTTYKKNGNKHRYAVPIDDVLLELLMRRANITGKKGPVFDMTDMKQLASRAIEKSGINENKPENQKFTIYGLKHCYASHLLMNGASIFDVAKLLGHTDPKMVFKNYGHLTQDYLRKVQAKVNLTPKLEETI